MSPEVKSYLDLWIQHDDILEQYQIIMDKLHKTWNNLTVEQQLEADTIMAPNSTETNSVVEEKVILEEDSK